MNHIAGIGVRIGVRDAERRRRAIVKALDGVELDVAFELLDEARGCLLLPHRVSAKDIEAAWAAACARGLFRR